MKSTKFYLLLLVVFISSCKKEQSNGYGQILNLSSSDMIDHYYGFDHIRTDGQFVFESIVPNNDSIYKNTVQVYGFFSDKNGLAQTGGGPVSIGGYEMTLYRGLVEYTSDSVLPNKFFYGTNVTFSFTPPNNNNIPITGSLYSPLPVYITNIPPITPLTIKHDSSTIIKWNKDPNNQKGVVLSVQGSGYTNGFSILVPDNGSYTLPWSFFSKLNTASSTLWIERGNYTILQNGQNKYKIGGYTSNAIWEVNIEQ